MSWLRALLMLLLAPLLVGAVEPKLVPDVSQREIEIRYSFTVPSCSCSGRSCIPAGACRAIRPISWWS
jgi:hypothetical protein